MDDLNEASVKYIAYLESLNMRAHIVLADVLRAFADNRKIDDDLSLRVSKCIKANSV